MGGHTDKKKQRNLSLYLQGLAAVYIYPQTTCDKFDMPGFKIDVSLNYFRKIQNNYYLIPNLQRLDL